MQRPDNKPAALSLFSESQIICMLYKYILIRHITRDDFAYLRLLSAHVKAFLGSAEVAVSLSGLNSGNKPGLFFLPS